MLQAMPWQRIVLAALALACADATRVLVVGSGGAPPPMLAQVVAADVRQVLYVNGSAAQSMTYGLWVDVPNQRWRTETPNGAPGCLNLTLITDLPQAVQYQVCTTAQQTTTCSVRSISGTQPAFAVDPNAQDAGPGTAEGEPAELWTVDRPPSPPWPAEHMEWAISAPPTTPPILLRTACTIQYPAGHCPGSASLPCTTVGVREFANATAGDLVPDWVFAKPPGVECTPTEGAAVSEALTGSLFNERGFSHERELFLVH